MTEERQSDENACEICGEPMPEGEEMFKYHGYSGPCPKREWLEKRAKLEEGHSVEACVEERQPDEKLDDLAQESADAISQLLGRVAELEQQLAEARAFSQVTDNGRWERMKTAERAEDDLRAELKQTRAKAVEMVAEARAQGMREARKIMLDMLVDIPLVIGQAIERAAERELKPR